MNPRNALISQRSPKPSRATSHATVETPPPTFPRVGCTYPYCSYATYGIQSGENCSKALLVDQHRKTILLYKLIFFVQAALYVPGVRLELTLAHAAQTLSSSLHGIEP